MKYKLYCDGHEAANLRRDDSDNNSPFKSVVLRSESFLNNESNDFGKEELPLSMVYSAGESKPYSLYFFEGNESRWFFKEVKYVFEVLFNKMNDCQPNWSRMMKKVVLVNNNGPLFEMMDGRLYLFDIRTYVLSPFFIENSSQIKCIGSGIMSNVIMLQTVDGKIIKKDFEKEPLEIKINDTSFVKVFSCYCRDLQIIVLENNKFFIIKAGSTYDSHYGFLNGPIDQAIEIETTFESGIKKISSGYGHCVILLDNGQVFSRGLNNYYQCAKPENVDIENEFYEITRIGHPVTDIECGSVGSVFRTRTHFVFFGSLYTEFDKKGYWHEIENDDQQVSIGPWHALIFRNKYSLPGKSELYFLNNLKMVSRQQFETTFSDTNFSFK